MGLFGKGGWNGAIDTLPNWGGGSITRGINRGMDPGDIFGQQQQERQQQLEDRYNEQTGQINQLMTELPNRHSTYKPLGGIGVNSYGSMLSDSLDTNDSIWATKAKQQANEQNALSMDRLNASGNRDAANAMNSLAMSGGLEGGAAENLLAQNNRSMLGSRADLSAAGNQNISNIGIQDAAQKNQMRQAASQGLLNIDQFNNQNWANNQNLANQYNMDKWKQKGAMYGSQWTGRAMMDQGKGAGGLFGGLGSIMNP